MEVQSPPVLANTDLAGVVKGAESQKSKETDTHEKVAAEVSSSGDSEGWAGFEGEVVLGRAWRVKRRGGRREASKPTHQTR